MRYRREKGAIEAQKSCYMMSQTQHCVIVTALIEFYMMGYAFYVTYNILLILIFKLFLKIYNQI